MVKVALAFESLEDNVCVFLRGSSEEYQFVFLLKLLKHLHQARSEAHIDLFTISLKYYYVEILISWVNDFDSAVVPAYWLSILSSDKSLIKVEYHGLLDYNCILSMFNLTFRIFLIHGA